MYISLSWSMWNVVLDSVQSVRPLARDHVSAELFSTLQLKHFWFNLDCDYDTTHYKTHTHNTPKSWVDHIQQIYLSKCIKLFDFQ